MEKEFCCPEGSWPALQTSYQAKGQKILTNNTKFYHVGDGKKVLVMISDIFGSESGRHEAFADTFASFGYEVYLPQILTKPYSGEMKGNLIVNCIKHQNFEIMRERFADLCQYLSQKGTKRFFVIGFCWGVWFAFKMAKQFDNIICIGGMHPALGLEHNFGGDVHKLAHEIKCPVHLFPAGNDPDDIKKNGDVIKIIQKRFGTQKVGTHEYPEMVHGWTVRGDITDEKVKRDTSDAIMRCRKYFDKLE